MACIRYCTTWQQLTTGKHLGDFRLNDRLDLPGVGPELNDLEASLSEQFGPGILGALESRQQGHHLDIHGGLIDAGSRRGDDDLVDKKLRVSLHHDILDVPQEGLGGRVGPVVQDGVHVVGTGSCN